MSRVSKITMTIGVTRNLGDFNSVRIDVGGEVLLDEPLDTTSPDYLSECKELRAALRDQVSRTERLYIKEK